MIRDIQDFSTPHQFDVTHCGVSISKDPYRVQKERKGSIWKIRCCSKAICISRSVWHISSLPHVPVKKHMMTPVCFLYCLNKGKQRKCIFRKSRDFCSTKGRTFPTRTRRTLNFVWHVAAPHLSISRYPDAYLFIPKFSQRARSHRILVLALAFCLLLPILFSCQFLSKSLWAKIFRPTNNLSAQIWLLPYQKRQCTFFCSSSASIATFLHDEERNLLQKLTPYYTHKKRT